MIIFFFPLIAPAALLGLDPLLMDIKILGMEKTAAPELFGQTILFSYRPDSPVRLVAARFEHENYQALHPYSRNEYGVFVLLYPVPEEIQNLKYRLLVGGLWMHDSTNPSYVADNSGLLFSTLNLEGRPLAATVNPQITGGGWATFTYKSLPAQVVSLIGDFNNWDPFSHRLVEESRGIYTISVHTLPGRHFYTFLIGGERVLDPYNPDSATDYEGYTTSTFFMP